jgi:hypothetical protein
MQQNPYNTMGCVYWFIWIFWGRVLRVGFNQVANQSITQSIDQLSTQSMNESIIQIKSLAARNRCSGVPRSHLALEITARGARPFFAFATTLANAAPALALGAAARASVVGFDNTFAFLAESLSKSLSNSLCFELCIASRCALCDSTGTVRCHMRI